MGVGTKLDEGAKLGEGTEEVGSGTGSTGAEEASTSDEVGTLGRFPFASGPGVASVMAVSPSEGSSLF